jgi:hypothetical protein
MQWLRNWQINDTYGEFGITPALMMGMDVEWMWIGLTLAV